MVPNEHPVFLHGEYRFMENTDEVHLEKERNRQKLIAALQNGLSQPEKKQMEVVVGPFLDKREWDSEKSKKVTCGK